jgi:hypothetical protein
MQIVDVVTASASLRRACYDRKCSHDADAGFVAGTAGVRRRFSAAPTWDRSRKLGLATDTRGQPQPRHDHPEQLRSCGLRELPLPPAPNKCRRRQALISACLAAQGRGLAPAEPARIAWRAQARFAPCNSMQQARPAPAASGRVLAPRPSVRSIRSPSESR